MQEWLAWWTTTDRFAIGLRGATQASRAQFSSKASSESASIAAMVVTRAKARSEKSHPPPSNHNQTQEAQGVEQPPIEASLENAVFQDQQAASGPAQASNKRLQR